MKKIVSVVMFLLLFCFIPHVASAHEVYVLNHDEISFALNSPAPDFIETIRLHLTQFFTWGLLTLAIIVGIFFVSISRPLEKKLDPFLIKIKTFAPKIAQFTLGISLFAGGYYKAIFGIELPVSAVFGNYSDIVSWVLIVMGSMLILGIIPRIVAMFVMIVFLILVGHYHVYMLNYGTYAGEAITLLLFGGAYHVVEVGKLGRWFTRIGKKIAPKFLDYKYLIMRILFGISLLYASLYAKLFHGQLALDTVAKYHLTQYFHFDPVFLVMGAMAIEVLLGLFFIFGFEIRFASLFFLAFLSMSLVFFGEAVWPHLILIGTASSMFVHGYDKYCLSARLFKKKNLEPVL